MVCYIILPCYNMSNYIERMRNLDKTAIFIDGGYFSKVLTGSYNRACIDFSKLSAELSGRTSILRIYYAIAVLQVVSGIGVLISIIMLVTGEKLGGIVFLILSFLISPLGIPAIAEWLIDKLDDLNYSLRNYITS